MDVEQSVIANLGSLTKMLNNKANHIFKNAGYHIRIEQVPVLMALFYQGPLSQQEIANIVLRDKSSILRSVKTLCRSGLLKIEDDLHDKRKNIVTLTPSGKKLSMMVQQGMINLESILFAHIAKEDQYQLIEIIKLMELKLNTIEFIVEPVHQKAS